MEDNGYFVQSLNQEVYFSIDNFLMTKGASMQSSISGTKLSSEEYLITYKKPGKFAGSIVSYTNILYILIYFVLHLTAEYSFISSLYTHPDNQKIIRSLNFKKYLLWKFNLRISNELSLEMSQLMNILAIESILNCTVKQDEKKQISLLQNFDFLSSAKSFNYKNKANYTTKFSNLFFAVFFAASIAILFTYSIDFINSTNPYIEIRTTAFKEIEFELNSPEVKLNSMDVQTLIAIPEDIMNS